MGLSIPVAFQNPDPVTLFGLMLFLYFLPLMQKKYHSLSPTVLTSSYFNKRRSIRSKSMIQLKLIYIGSKIYYEVSHGMPTDLNYEVSCRCWRIQLETNTKFRSWIVKCGR